MPRKQRIGFGSKNLGSKLENTMRVVIDSEDRELTAVCQEVVARLSADGHPMILAGWYERTEGDVCLWDLRGLPANLPERGTRPAGLDIYLIDRPHLAEVLDRFPQLAPSVLLKPVNPVALEAFLVQRAAQSSASRSGQEAALTVDRDTLLRCLLHASLRLQEFDQDRTHFWARAAHDLRAPLTAAAGYCDLLLEEKAGALAAGQRELLTRMRHSLGKLSRMASSMFQLTAGRCVQRELELKRVEIEETIRHAADEVRAMANTKQIRMIVDLKAAGRTMYIEPGQIEQVVVNLLENACKFTPRHGAIEVRGYPVCAEPGFAPAATHAEKETANAYRVDIADTGSGVAPEHVHNIFEEFVSIENSGDRSGTGLGLAISKLVVRAHHGHIWAEAHPDGGRFSFVIPYHRPVAVEYAETRTAAIVGAA